MIRLVISSKIALVVALKKVVLGGGWVGVGDRDRAEWIDDKETRKLLQKIQKKRQGRLEVWAGLRDGYLCNGVIA